KNYEAVRQRDAFRLRDGEAAQRRRLDLARIRNLRVAGSCESEKRGRRGDCMSSQRFHFASPFGAMIALVCAGLLLSIYPTVRFSGVNVFATTRLMSAAVTLSMRSTLRN